MCSASHDPPSPTTGQSPRRGSLPNSRTVGEFMNSELFRRAADIFLHARSLPPESREAFIKQACGEDSALRSEVERFLNADELKTPFPTLSQDLDTLRDQLRADAIQAADRVG